MPARKRKTALKLLEGRIRSSDASPTPAEAPKPQELPEPPGYFNAVQATAWQDICRPLCQRRLWGDELALWAESFALLLVEAREQGESRPNRAILRLYARDLHALSADTAAPQEDPFEGF